MADPSVFDAIRIPTAALIAVDSRPLHFVMQRYHYLIRLVHILTTGAFFGGILLLDLRLMGWRGTVPLRGFAQQVLPWLYVTFAIAMATGLALFLYDPLRVGARAYFSPKLLAIVLGLVNALIFHRTSYLAALAAERHVPFNARAAGFLSLAFWTAVVVFSSLNTESVPNVILR